MKKKPMTLAKLKRIADSVGGPLALAELLGVGKDWVYRRISGKSPIEYVDELAIRKALESRERKGRRLKSNRQVTRTHQKER